MLGCFFGDGSENTGKFVPFISVTVLRFRNKKFVPECLPDKGPAQGSRCQSSTEALPIARNIDMAWTLKRVTTFANLLLIVLLRISMLPRVWHAN